MALSTRQKVENRKDLASGKDPRNKSDPFTAVDISTVDGTYGTEESDVITNNRARLIEVAQLAADFGFIV